MQVDQSGAAQFGGPRLASTAEAAHRAIERPGFIKKAFMKLATQRDIDTVLEVSTRFRSSKVRTTCT